MRYGPRPLLALGLAFLALVLAPGSAPAQARASFTLYTSESLDQVSEMKQDFERRTPGVTMNIYRSGTQLVISKIQAEIQAAALQADLIWMADIDFFEDLVRRDLLLRYVPAEADKLPAKFRYADGRYYEVRLIFNTVAFHTDRVKERPTGWMDLLQPRARGKVGMASPFYSGAAFSTLGTLVNRPGFGWEFYQKLKGNDVVVEQSNGTVAKKLAAGEFHLASVVDFMVRNLKNQGSPVDHIWPKEGAILVPTPIGIHSKSKHAEAAKAFLRYVLTAEGQRLFVKQGYVPVLPGIDGPKGTPSEPLEVVPTDQKYIDAHREELKAKFKSLFER
jgi:iron(III) transport system substrate-binding protein